MSTAALRELIATTATRLGPEAATLCTPWTVHELLAHLVIRERRPDALPGIGFPVSLAQRHTASVQQTYADKGLPELVQMLRVGPPRWWPTRIPLLDRMVNSVELAVHHEDMVRAQPDWEPTPLSPALENQLWQSLGTVGALLYRSAPVGVVALWDDGDEIPSARRALRAPRATGRTVVLRGQPLELILHAVGRDQVARLQIEGRAEDVAALARHRRGL